MQTYLLNLEFIPYRAALSLMRELATAGRDAGVPGTLILAEHEPVFTLGRGASEDDILVDSEILDRRNITTHRVERGGRVTYHGPGQLMAYPVFNLKQLGLGIARFVNKLETVVINTLESYNIEAGRLEGKPGVWVGEKKIASIGLAVKRYVTFHGLALNYDPDLENFDLINPCGLRGTEITSMAKILKQKISGPDVRETMIRHFEEVFSLQTIPPALDTEKAVAV